MEKNVKDLIQEGRKIQETFKKNVLIESQFKVDMGSWREIYSKRPGYKPGDKAGVVVRIDYYIDSQFKSFIEKMKSKFTGKVPDIESIRIMKPVPYGKTLPEDTLEMSIIIHGNEPIPNSKPSPRTYIVNIGDDGNIVQNVKSIPEYDSMETRLPKDPNTKKMIEELAKKIFKEFHTGSTYRDLVRKASNKRPTRLGI